MFWRRRFVKSVWATHNNSPQIRKTLKDRLSQLEQGSRGLNVGSGSTVLHPRLVNIDILPAPGVHVLATSEQLPFPDGVFDLVMSQEVLEHVRDPFESMREMKRVLKQAGVLYCQVPFVIGYHPGPTDFWRFTREGVCQLVEQAGLECGEVIMAVGPGTGAYRIIVEFLATVAAWIASALYLPAKGLLAIILYPLKWLDPILSGSTSADRVAGGYLVTARHRGKEAGSRSIPQSTS
jgi:SAM-dependent methyltransferase